MRVALFTLIIIATVAFNVDGCIRIPCKISEFFLSNFRFIFTSPVLSTRYRLDRLEPMVKWSTASLRMQHLAPHHVHQLVQSARALFYNQAHVQ